MVRERAGPPDAARQQAVFERLARRHYAGVCSYLCWLSRDAALAEDLTQETFVRAWQHPPEDRGDRALRAWIFRLAHNEYLQHRRRAGLAVVALEEGTGEETVDRATPSAQAQLEQTEFSQAVRAAVARLPELCRAVIVLHNLEGLSLREVAEVLGIPVGTVKSRRAKARLQLREALAGQEVVR